MAMRTWRGAESMTIGVREKGSTSPAGGFGAVPGAATCCMDTVSAETVVFAYTAMHNPLSATAPAERFNHLIKISSSMTEFSSAPDTFIGEAARQSYPSSTLYV